MVWCVLDHNLILIVIIIYLPLKQMLFSHSSHCPDMDEVYLDGKQSCFFQPPNLMTARMPLPVWHYGLWRCQLMIAFVAYLWIWWWKDGIDRLWGIERWQTIWLHVWNHFCSRNLSNHINKLSLTDRPHGTSQTPWNASHCCWWRRNNCHWLVTLVA